MKRIFSVLAVAALMVAMLVASALPALARSCVDEQVTSQLGPGQQGNTFGQGVSEQTKQLHPLGQSIQPLAHGETCSP